MGPLFLLHHGLELLAILTSACSATSAVKLFFHNHFRKLPPVYARFAGIPKAFPAAIFCVEIGTWFVVYRKPVGWFFRENDRVFH